MNLSSNLASLFVFINDSQLCSDGFGSLLEQMVEALCRHVSDDSPTVRRLCLRGLVQVLLKFVVFNEFNEKLFSTHASLAIVSTKSLFVSWKAQNNV